MPQPIKSGQFPMYTPSAVAERPELAVHIALVCAHWSNVETTIGMLLSHILGAHAEIGVAMYLGLSSAAAQRSAIEAAAQAQLEDPLLTEVMELGKKIGKRQKERNEIAHGVWGILEEYPDSLILSDSRDHIRFHAAVPSLAHALFRKKVAKVRPGLRYREQDFIDIENRILQLNSEIAQILHKLPEIPL